MVQSVFCIINPASGIKEPVLSDINEVFYKAGIKWDVAVTQAPGAENQAILKAFDSDAEAVAVYGGDGTQAQVASQIYGRQTKPLIVLPGGTANVFARSLGMPTKTRQCLELIANDQMKMQKIDIALANRQPLLLAITTGIVAKNVIITPRESKQELGPLTYLANFFKILPNTPAIKYRLDIDGKEKFFSAVALVIANSGMEAFDHADGMVDILAIHNARPDTLIKSLVVADKAGIDGVSHWRARKTSLIIPKEVPTLVDDIEISTPARYEITVNPKAMDFLVPRS